MKNEKSFVLQIYAVIREQHMKILESQLVCVIYDDVYTIQSQL